LHCADGVLRCGEWTVGRNATRLAIPAEGNSRRSCDAHSVTYEQTIVLASMTPPLRNYTAIESELRAMLGAAFDGMTIEAGHSPRWRRMQLVLRWEGFAGLLPEERFRKIMQVIPADYYEQTLRGAVFFELTADESIEQFMGLPRSDDVVDDEPRVIRMLDTVGFFNALRASLGSAPAEACGGDLSAARRLLRARGVPAADVVTACLTFIRHGAFCDCEALPLSDRLASATRPAS